MSKPGIYMMLGDPTDKKPEVYTGRALRAKYDGQISDGHTTVDLVFTSSSTAVTYAASSNRSGNATWRTSDGTRLSEMCGTSPVTKNKKV
jgi:hypothetical protein